MPAASNVQVIPITAAGRYVIENRPRQVGGGVAVTKRPGVDLISVWLLGDLGGATVTLQASIEAEPQAATAEHWDDLPDATGATLALQPGRSYALTDNWPAFAINVVGGAPDLTLRVAF